MFNISIDDVKAYLGYTDNTRDLQVEAIMDAVFAAMKTMTGRNLERANYKDTFQLAGPRVYVNEYPIQEISSVVISNSAVAETSYTLFKASGLLHFTTELTQHYVCPGTYLIVEYVGGYETLPADMKLAFYNAVQAADNFQKQLAQFGGPVKRLAVYDVGVTDLAVPREGMQAAIQASLADGLGQYVERHRSLGGWLVRESEYVSPYVGSP